MPIRYKEMVKCPIYGNCVVQSPDGHDMFRCVEKKANWYLSRNMAVIVSENPLTIRLTFQPKGPGHFGDPFYLQEKQNICVVCGKSEELTKHHIVPFMYRSHWPNKWKKYSSYDIVPLCATCHGIYEISADKLKHVLAEEYHVAYKPVVSPDSSLVRALKSAFAILNHGSKIPAKRIDFLISNVTVYLGHSPTQEELVELSQRSLDGIRQPERHWQEGDQIMAKLKEEDGNCGPLLLGFVMRWRQHFVDTMKPKHLPKNWTVERVLNSTRED